MALNYRVTPLPTTWPGGARTPSYSRQRPQFKTIWTRALDLLEREIGMLGGTNVEIAVDVEPRHLRNDGQMRADARPSSSAVVVSFDSRKYGRLVFPADTFSFWQENVDAIARVLEDRRRAERYGVRPGKPYADFKAIAATSSTTLTTGQAAQVLVSEAGAADDAADDVLRSPLAARDILRIAKARTHPDASGSTERFTRVGAAEAVIKAHHGGAL